MGNRKYKCRIFQKLQIRALFFVDINYYLFIFNEIEDGMYEFTEEVLNSFEYENFEEYRFVMVNFNKLKNNIRNEPQKYGKNITGEFILCLHPSNICNLNCEYCFRETVGNSIKLSFETAKAAIDFLINDYAPNASKYIVDLSGSGEPLLNYDLVKKITDYCNSVQDKLGKSVAVMFATNGTIKLEKSQISYLEENVTIGVSLDGSKEVNDFNRHNSYGIGTYEDTINFMNQFPSKKFGVAVTITPQNQQISKIYDDLSSIDKIDCISMKPVRSFNENCYDTDKLDTNELLDEYIKLCYNIVEQLENENIDYFKRILKGNDYFGKFIQRNIHKNYRNYFACDAGFERIAVDSKGYIYACTVLTGNDNFIIGNINDGIFKEKHVFYNEIDTEKDDTCKECLYKWICGGECYANSYLSHKKMYRPVSNLCILRRDLIELSICFIEYIKRNYYKYYCEMVLFLEEVTSYQRSNTAIWSVIQILDFNNIETKYKLVEEKLKIDKSGVNKPINTLNCLNSYIDNFKLYRLDNTMLFREICFPCIAIVNKVPNSNYEYIVVEGVDYDNVYYKTVFSNKDFMKKSDFIKYVSDLYIAEKRRDL